MSLEWGAPPPIATNTSKPGMVAQFVEQLKQRPGEWAKYPSTLGHAVVVTQNRQRFPGTEWTSRHRDDGRYDIYGRWVGES